MADADSRTSQFRKGAVELAILALLACGEMYGAEIVERLAVLPGLAVTSGTVYPLLGRLKRAGLVDSIWRESPVGPPRKYYRLAEAGSRDLAGMSAAWRDLSSAIDSLLQGVDSRG